MKKYKMKINGEKYTTHIKEYKGHSIIVEVNGNDYLVELDTEKPNESTPMVRSQKSAPEVKLSNPQYSVSLDTGNVVAPIPGTIMNIKVKEGDVVKEGDTVIILEAMKMESDISAPISGTVKKIHVKDGASVTEGMLMMEIGE
jgi:glutaconyl-CoA/methylmalonyl-CoA decarboxylase subunit gamma